MWMVQVIFHSRDPDRYLLHAIGSVRRSSVLAHPRHVLFRTFYLDDAPANTVSLLHLLLLIHKS